MVVGFSSEVFPDSSPVDFAQRAPAEGDGNEKGKNSFPRFPLSHHTQRATRERLRGTSGDVSGVFLCIFFNL